MKQNQKNHKAGGETTPVGPIDCILCAAGESSRMGLWKPLLPWKNGAVIDAAVSAALKAACRVILVTGYRGEELEDRFRGRPGVVTVRNPHWQRGMVSSILTGARYSQGELFFVSHADMPLIPPEVYQTLRDWADQDRHRAEPSGYPRAWRCTFQGKPGHPVLFERSIFPLIEQIGQGESLKALFDLCELRSRETEEPGVLMDLDDTPDYLRSLLLEGGRTPPSEIAKTEVSQGQTRLPGALVPELKGSDRPELPNGLAVSARAEPWDGSKGENEPEGVVEIITGPKGSGKTSALRLRVYGTLVDRQPLCAVYQRQTGRNADGIGRAFELEALSWVGGTSADYVKRLLCVQATDPLVETYRENGFSPTEPLGPFLFDTSVFQTALDVVRRFLREPVGRSRVFFLDELGKLELERSRGLFPLVELIVQAIQADRRRGLNSRLVCAARLDTLDLLEALFSRWGLPFSLTTLTPRGNPLPPRSSPRTAGRSGENGR